MSHFMTQLAGQLVPQPVTYSVTADGQSHN